MGKLAETEKRFVIKCLAAYTPPTEVAATVMERFGKRITPSGILSYHPDKKQGAELSPRLRALFTRERRRFHKQLDDIPIAHVAYRLQALQDVLDTRSRNSAAVLKALTAARAECAVGTPRVNPRRERA